MQELKTETELTHELADLVVLAQDGDMEGMIEAFSKLEAVHTTQLLLLAIRTIAGFTLEAREAQQ